MAETIFAKIGRGESDVELIYEDDHCVAFSDIAPQAPVHILVIPRLPHKDATQTDNVLLGHVVGVAAQLGAQRCPGGFRLVTNVGEDGGQTVAHLHVHVLGGRLLRWPPG